MVRRRIFALFLLVPPGLAGGQPPLRVTTDNHDYCEVLIQRIAGTPGRASGPARQLAQQGAALCANGHHRSGIAKLRRAMRVALAEVP